MTKRTIYGKNPHYQYRDQDPVIDDMWFFAKASGLKLNKLAMQMGLSPRTLYNWFYAKSTKSPRHDSVQIFFRSFGIKYGRHGGKEENRKRLRVVA